MVEMMKQAEGLIDSLARSITSHDGTVAIGVDMAASENNWGICVLMVSRDLATAELRILLPQAKRNADNSLSPTLYCRPSFAILKAILQIVTENRIVSSMGVDVPFGWPTEHSKFVDAWSAQDGWPEKGGLPDRSRFEMRLTDEQLKEHQSSIAPFAVGADTIAQAAYRWAQCRNELSSLVGMIDVGLEDLDDGRLITFETYPGAFVKLASPKHHDYKSKPEVRRSLLSAFPGLYPIHTDETTANWQEWAINQKGNSPDAFDALLCAVTAWGHLRWRANRGAHPMTTPAKLMGRSVSSAERERIQREGWILVPTTSIG